MPLHKGHSPEIVRANIKEMVKSGYRPKQAVAASLAKARKYKKMSDGGQVVSDGGMGDMPQEEYFKGGKDESMEKMDRKGPEDFQRSLNEIREDGEYYPSEVANPNEQDEARGFAAALRRKAMGEMSPEGYAYGGMVQDGPEGDEPVGNKPAEGNEKDGGMDSTMTENETSMGRPGIQGLEHSKMGEPETSSLGLSEEAKEAIRMKKKRRMYGMYDPK